jgi:hypothetical protein
MIGMREWIMARDPIEAQITTAKRRLAQTNGVSALERYVGSADLLRQEWDSLSVERRQAIVKAVIHQIVIRPAPLAGRRRFAPERVQTSWRF